MNLAELKAVPKQELQDRWTEAIFPFDITESCFKCPGSPDYLYCCSKHQEFVLAVAHCGLLPMQIPMRGSLHITWALRIKFAALYSSPLPEDALVGLPENFVEETLW
jgi:hypothetical protein